VKITVPVCDVCKQLDRPTRQYDLREGTRRAKPELCDEHGAPFEAFLDLTPPPPGRGRRSRVTTMDEIEQQKKQHHQH